MSFFNSAGYNFFKLVYIFLTTVVDYIHIPINCFMLLLCRRTRRIPGILPVTWVGQLGYLGQLGYPPYEARVGGGSPRVIVVQLDGVHVSSLLVQMQSPGSYNALRPPSVFLLSSALSSASSSPDGLL